MSLPTPPVVPVSPLLAAALSYAARGWAVFPLHSPLQPRNICSCMRSDCDRVGKHPRTQNGLSDATTDAEQIRAWWSRWPTASVGLRTGNGLVVVDCDPGRADTEAFERSLPATLTALTGGGGRHYFFAGAAPCSQDRLAPGVDVRGDGGYVVAAPSLHASGRRYGWDLGSPETVADLPNELASQLQRPVPGAPEGAPTLPQPGSPKATRRARAWLAKRAPAISGQQGHTHTLTTAAHVLAFGLDEVTAFAELWAWNLRCEPPWSEHDLRRKVSEAAKSQILADLLAKRAAAPPPRDPSDPRPVIRIGVDLHRVVAEAVVALGKDLRTYQRGGQLVHVARDEAITNTLLVRAMRPATVKVRLSACAAWEKLDGRSNSFCPASPPDDVVQAVACAGEYQGVRPLVGLLEAPALIEGGEVLQEPGYDARSGYLYDPQIQFPSIPAQPTREDALAALGQLEEIFMDFPFARDEHASAAVAALLTCFARPAIAGPVPMFAVDATTAGTGKGRLVDAISILFLGREAPKTGLPEDEDELAKTLTSIVNEGAPLGILDNVTKPVTSKQLDLTLTSNFLKQRILGTNTTASVPHRTVWFLTGNNVELGGDLHRRVIPVRLESKLENPEARNDFRHPDLLAWVLAERPRLAVAALTILRAFVVAGCPLSESWRPLGSFEAWSALVPPALTWLDRADPCDARADLSAHDSNKGALLVLVEHWKTLDPMNRGVTASAIVQTLWPVGSPPPQSPGHPELREALEQLTGAAQGKPPSTLRVGHVLKRFRRRVVNDMSLDSRTIKGGAQAWQLRHTPHSSQDRSVQNSGSRGDDYRKSDEERVKPRQTTLSSPHIISPYRPHGSHPSSIVTPGGSGSGGGSEDPERDAIQGEQVGSGGGGT